MRQLLAGARLFTGERMMLAHVYLEKGAIVPKHAHENEQPSWIFTNARVRSRRASACCVSPVATGATRTIFALR